MATDLEKLLQTARTGNAGAAGPLLERYRNYLMVLAQVQIGRRLQGKVDAADLVQETYLQAHRDIGQFRGVSEGEFVQWLRRILGTTLARTVRRFFGTQSRDVRLECDLISELDQSSQHLDGVLIAGDSTPSHQAARREQAVILADALARLPEDYRTVLILRHMEGLTFPEIAQSLARTEDSVKKLWTRALAQLRTAMGEEA